ncbi:MULTISPECIES: hypothetical protein [unclassified Chelatococcus]|uniref:hypothetical protein n=1 Tax=unclassified Chelatococcus TaxID=2638111 RepID=UPI001BCF8731|nr:MULTISPECIES: hypothetical protein [unclassified Chelatococcus]MBS7742706.1 hypothetical protein [Chelatococcus sp. HY11]MBX3542176.1 hypothetical protein [Chelatococcus sp.]MCO5075608.1 hypothetical protein [Chelatococcus sp.]
MARQSIAIVGARTDPASITQAFIVAILCIACCLAAGAALGITLARRSGAG